MGQSNAEHVTTTKNNTTAMAQRSDPEIERKLKTIEKMMQDHKEQLTRISDQVIKKEKLKNLPKE